MAQHASCLRSLACSKEAPAEDPKDRTRALGARGSCIELHVSLKRRDGVVFRVARGIRQDRCGDSVMKTTLIVIQIRKWLSLLLAIAETGFRPVSSLCIILRELFHVCSC